MFNRHVIAGLKTSKLQPVSCLVFANPTRRAAKKHLKSYIIGVHTHTKCLRAKSNDTSKVTSSVFTRTKFVRAKSNQETPQSVSWWRSVSPRSGSWPYRIRKTIMISIGRIDNVAEMLFHPHAKGQNTQRPKPLQTSYMKTWVCPKLNVDNQPCMCCNHNTYQKASER